MITLKIPQANAKGFAEVKIGGRLIGRTRHLKQGGEESKAMVVTSVRQYAQKVKPFTYLKEMSRTAKNKRQLMDGEYISHKPGKHSYTMSKAVQDRMCFQFEPGDNSKQIASVMQIASLQPVDTFDGDAVRQRIGEYFAICAEHDEKPNVPGLALALGTSRSTLWRWKTGEVHRPMEVQEAVRQAYAALNALHESNMLEGRINNVTGIFLAKANYGYTENPTEEITDNSVLGAMQTMDEIQADFVDVGGEED